MGNHVDLVAGNLVDLLQKLGRKLAHNNKPIRQLCDLLHDHELVGIRLAKDGVEGSDNRHLQGAQ